MTVAYDRDRKIAPQPKWAIPRNGNNGDRCVITLDGKRRNRKENGLTFTVAISLCGSEVVVSSPWQSVHGPRVAAQLVQTPHSIQRCEKCYALLQEAVPGA